jgi:hypothetical protein
LENITMLDFQRVTYWGAEKDEKKCKKMSEKFGG